MNVRELRVRHSSGSRSQTVFFLGGRHGGTGTECWNNAKCNAECCTPGARVQCKNDGGTSRDCGSDDDWKWRQEVAGGQEGCVGDDSNASPTCPPHNLVTGLHHTRWRKKQGLGAICNAGSNSGLRRLLWCMTWAPLWCTHSSCTAGNELVTCPCAPDILNSCNGHGKIALDTWQRLVANTLQNDKWYQIGNLDH